MTIAAAYLTSEGVVLGADSTITIGNGVQMMNHNQKVFEIGKDSTFGLCTFGAGVIGGTSHRTIAALLGDWVGSSQTAPTTEQVAGELAAMVQRLAPNSPDFSVGYYVGGCDPATRDPQCFHVAIGFDPQASALATSISQLGIGAHFAGQPRFFTRLFMGIDHELQQHLRVVLGPMIDPVDPAQGAAQFDSVLQALLPNYVAQGFTDLPIRDAIDYLHSILHVTIKAMKFKFGTPVCGGLVELGVITTDRKFRWVLHKGFDSAIHDHLHLRPWNR